MDTSKLVDKLQFLCQAQEKCSPLQLRNVKLLLFTLWNIHQYFVSSLALNNKVKYNSALWIKYFTLRRNENQIFKVIFCNNCYVVFSSYMYTNKLCVTRLRYLAGWIMLDWNSTLVYLTPWYSHKRTQLWRKHLIASLNLYYF